MNDFGDRGPMGLKEDVQRENPAHMGRVAELPCVICEFFQMVQLSPTQVHHCIHGRYSSRRAPDEDTLPLCEGHHQGLLDVTKLALHRHPERWEMTYGSDTDWLPRVKQKLKLIEEMTI